MRKKMISRAAPKAALLVGLVCIGALVAGGSASASGSNKGITDTVKIKQRPNGRPFFKIESDTVDPGNLIEVVNTTNPNQIGPHTFALVTKPSLPQGKDELKACGKLKNGTICKAIAKWHQITFNPFNVGQPSVETGNPGWDTMGKPKHQKGDSWFTQTQDETTSRIVSADPGTTLHFMCAVHPEMQGKIKVNQL